MVLSKKKINKYLFLRKGEVFFPWVGVFRPFLQTVSASSAPLGVIIFPGSGEKGFSSPLFSHQPQFPLSIHWEFGKVFGFLGIPLVTELALVSSSLGMQLRFSLFVFRYILS